MAAVDLNKALFDEAKKYIAGGVNSPVRAFGAVGGPPVFIKKAKGSRLYDEKGSEYIDYCLSWGALLLGHSHDDVVDAVCAAAKRGTSFGAVTAAETEFARMIREAFPSMEQVRLTSSGTEAVMSAVRLSRAYTGRDKVIKFEGTYHGHVDYLLVKAGSGAATYAIPDSAGVPAEFAGHTLTLPFNDESLLEEIVKRHAGQIAAIIVEPVMANAGVILPKENFLGVLGSICKKYGILLIFDEVITGFRLAYGGAQERFGVKPDITCLGKIIGGGLPAAAFGGSRDIMRLLAPSGDVYHAGTLAGNPLAVAAGISTLKVLKKKALYRRLEYMTTNLASEIRKAACKAGINVKVNNIASMFSVFFTDKDVCDYTGAKRQDTASFKKFFHKLLEDGVYFSPSGFEADFISTAHTDKDIEKTAKAIDRAFKVIGGA